MYHIFKLKQNKSIWNFSFMVSHTVYFTGMMVFTLTSQMYHRISVLVPVLVRVPEYLSTSTSTSTSTMTFELTSTSTLRVPESQYSSTASTSTEYESPSPGYDLEIWRMTLKNNRAPLVCCLKLCASFHSHQWILTGVTVRKRPIWVKIANFLSLNCDLHI